MMMKNSTQEEEVTIVVIHTSNIGAHQYIRHNRMLLSREKKKKMLVP